MKITVTVIGTGYVCLVSGTCLTEDGGIPNGECGLQDMVPVMGFEDLAIDR